MLDNAVAESFLATPRAELVDHERFATHQAAIHSIADYIDNFLVRRQPALLKQRLMPLAVARLLHALQSEVLLGR